MPEDLDASPLPHWDLSTVFPGLESPEFVQAVESCKAGLDEFETFIAERGIGGEGALPAGVEETAADINGFLERANTIAREWSTLRAYVSSFIDTDSYNNLARRLATQLQPLSVRMKHCFVVFSSWMGKLAQNAALWPAVLETGGATGQHAFYLQTVVEESRYLMSESEESLAAELSTSGANAWQRLHGTITSQTKAPFEADGQNKELPITVIRNYGNHPDEGVRRKAYETEIRAWKRLREPLAACLNGVKGAVNTLDSRRGREDALHSALEDARMDREILDALLEAMEASLPDFRRYLQAKARLLGKKRLAWWDLSAPVGRHDKRYTFPEARGFIVEQFASFSPDLAGLAGRAFDENWIDAEPRDGKRGGAFCMAILGVEESRILANFDGSLDAVSTLAHELGHAYHNHCQAGLPPLNRHGPYTLAETASIMNQTIVAEAVLSGVKEPDEELAILENVLQDACGTIVDIYSRFLFEKAVFERRSEAELSADELCELMLSCQREAYGDGLDQEHLNPYMWAWKPHYYRPNLSFYNFPYAFGLLFSLGLFALYRQQGRSFIPAYTDFLRHTGMGWAAELAERFDIDLRSTDFWLGGIAYVREKIDRYEQLA